MSDLTAVRDLVIVGVIGYVGYKFLNKQGIVPKIGIGIKKIGKKVYESGYKTGETIGKFTSDVQQQAFMFEHELKSPVTNIISDLPRRSINDIVDRNVLTVPQKSIFLQTIEKMIVPFPVRTAWEGAVNIAQKLWVR